MHSTILNEQVLLEDTFPAFCLAFDPKDIEYN